MLPRDSRLRRIAIEPQNTQLPDADEITLYINETHYREQEPSSAATVALPRRMYLGEFPYGLEFPRLQAIPVPTAALRWLLVAAICSLPILLFLPFLATPFMRDEAFYASVAQAMRHGAMPYEYGFDNKPPMIFYWYYLSFQAFGEHVWAPRLVAALLLSGASALMYIQGRLLFSRAGGLIAAVAFGLSMGIAKFEVNANTEYFMIPFTILALVAFTLGQRRGSWYWYVLCGAASMVAIMTKQTAVFLPLVFSAFTLYPLLRRRTLHRGRTALLTLAQLSAGGAALLVAIMLPIVATGTLDEFYRSAVVYAGQYTNDLTLADKLSTMLWPTPRHLVMSAGPLVLLAGAGIVCVLRKPNQGTLLLVCWFLAAAAGVIVAGRFYPHYFVALLPGMALLAVPALQWAKSSLPTRPAAVLLLGLLPLVAVSPLVTNAKIYLQPTPTERHLAQYPGSSMAVWEAQSKEAGEWIAQITRPGEKIYGFGFMPGIYFYSGRESPTQYIFKHPFAIDESYARDAVRQMEADKPVLILDSAIYEDDGTFAYHGDTVLSFIRENYDYQGKFYFGNLWTLKGWHPARPILPLTGSLAPRVPRLQGTLEGWVHVQGTLTPGLTGVDPNR